MRILRAEKSKLLRLVYDILSKAYCNILRKKLKTRASLFSEKIQWIYMDQETDLVKNRWKYRLNLKNQESFETKSNFIDFVSNDSRNLSFIQDELEKNKWHYLYLDPVVYYWRNFVWSFEYSCESKFHELQFGFRYVDFFNRYRYRIEDDYLHFDIVKNGAFYNSLHKVPLELELNKNYKFEVYVFKNIFKFNINGKTLSEDCDPFSFFSRGTVAIILWENSGDNLINADFKNINVHELVADSFVSK